MNDTTSPPPDRLEILRAVAIRKAASRMVKGDVALMELSGEESILVACAARRVRQTQIG